jgi:hypothetical protein
MNSFELNLYNILQCTGYQFIYKKQYTNHNINLIYTDFMINTSTYFICIYSNYFQSNLQNFVDEIKNLSYYYQKHCIGIYFNMYKLTNNEDKIIIDENKKNINHIINISNSNQNMLIKKFLKYLYTNNIFCYDNSRDCIMIDA